MVGAFQTLEKDLFTAENSEIAEKKTGRVGKSLWFSICSALSAPSAVKALAPQP
jgi:hypothetical protein